MHVNGRTYPSPHPDWQPYSEELFFYTSRYFPEMLQQLRQLAHTDENRQLAGFHASELSDVQRFVLAWMLSAPPTPANVATVLGMLGYFHQHQSGSS